MRRSRADATFPAVCFPVLMLALCLGTLSCSRGSGDDAPPGSGGSGEQDPAFRAIAGVSMGGYGALNIGTKRPDLFGAVGSLGGPVDMRELLRHVELDNLEVRPILAAPLLPSDDSTFDHLPIYPDRETRLEMLQDLVISFGNPFLHHPDPDDSYLATSSDPAQRRQDDLWGMLPAGLAGFRDGGDSNEDGQRQTTETTSFETDVMLLAPSTLSRFQTGAVGVDVGGREVADIDGDGVFDIGDALILNFREPFQDLDGDLIFSPQDGETFDDFGLDGVAGTNDFGEGNGVFDEDPDITESWLAEDPLTRLRERPVDEIAEQRFYFDAGTVDEFDFLVHYENLVDVLVDKGLSVRVDDGFSGNCIRIPSLPDPITLVRYDGGHVGIPSADDVTQSLIGGDFCGAVPVWQRLVHVIAFFEDSFADGLYGPAGLRVIGDAEITEIDTPTLDFNGLRHTREFLLYRPPAHFNTRRDLPIAYFLGGYGQDPGDFARVQELMDLLILSGQVQNMYLAFLEGAGGQKGSFYVNQRVPQSAVPGITEPTSGRYEDAILDDIIPFIETVMLEGRIRALR